MNIKKHKTRFYNQISVDCDIVTKTSTLNRVTTEYEWFLEAKHIIPNNIPLVHKLIKGGDNKGSLIMERINGDNLLEFCILNSDERNISKVLEFVSSVISLMDKKRLNLPKYQIKKDIRAMYLKKPLNAIGYFYERYPHFNSNNLTINKTICKNSTSVLRQLFNQFEQRLNTTHYSFLHGDLTLSNLMKSDEIILIDPRASFGFTQHYGDYRYELAKLYFGFVSKFDFFNHHNFSFKKYSGGINYTIDSIVDDDVAKKIFSSIFNKEDMQLIRFIDATIWLSLSPHLEESHEQTITAYIHGLLLLNQLASELEE